MTERSPYKSNISQTSALKETIKLDIRLSCALLESSSQVYWSQFTSGSDVISSRLNCAKLEDSSTQSGKAERVQVVVHGRSSAAKRVAKASLEVADSHVDAFGREMATTF
jgi:hypothetical protein